MIINDDCFDAIKKIENNTINCILIDPPYQISRESNYKKSNISTPVNLTQKYDISIDFGQWDKVDIDWDFLFQEYYRVLKKGGALIIFYDIWKSSELKNFAELNKFKQPRVCCWNKNNPVPINSKSNYLSNANEYFFTFVKGGKPVFNSEYDSGFYKFPICHGKERYNHPTQKPLALIQAIIEKHSNSGDVILDTFAGSGTTGHAAFLTNRNYILIEKDPIYFKIIQERLNKLII